jgi:serine phosphatase RsbU (regulator of sigma subunit)
MIYRFLPDGVGWVFAESHREGLEPYLGLHYPASDIPQQARRLYVANRLRLIVDVAYRPVPIEPVENPRTGAPLDLSRSVLRSVSPVHVEYLRNMGVAASMSMSIVVNDQLWGLLLCHGSERHLVPSELRTACEQIAKFVSRHVATRWHTARLTEDLRQQHLRSVLVDQIDDPVPADGLVGDVGLLDLVPGDTAVGRLNGRTVVSGDVVDAATVDRLVDLIRARRGGEGYVSESLRRDLPEVSALLDRAGYPTVAGVLLAPSLGRTGGDYLAWLRREVEQTVDWAGEPTVKHQADSLSPRASFDLWREKVRDQSEPWQVAEVQAATALADAVRGRLNRLDEIALAAAAARTEELLRREHEVADALQRAMLPVLPQIADLTLSAAYVSASESAEVGGDWYDVFTLPDTSTGIAMGDVTGHDLSAAAMMGQLRSVLRSYAWEQTDPAQVLDKLDALVDGFAMHHLATVFFARLEREPDQAGSLLLRYANAGHLPPLLRLPDGTVEVLEDGVSVLIGVGVGIAHVNAEKRVRLGSTLLLYTDGLVEQRDRGFAEGIEQLRTVLAEGPEEPDALREHILERMVPGSREDDIAVLVVQLSSRGS